MKIYKYELDLTHKQTLELPQGAQILTIQLQDGKIVLWALVDDKCKLIKGNRFIECYYTGKEIEISHELTYISTIQYNGLVYHFFERK